MNFDPHASGSPPTTLADVLEARHEDIIQRWTGRLREGLAPGPRTQAELEDHIGEYLWEMTRTLRQHRESRDAPMPEWLPVAREHGGQRLRIGFDVQALVREYHVLRECVLDVVEESGVRVTLGEVRALAAFITTSIAEGVAEYLRQRDAVQRLDEARLRTLLDQAPAAIFAKDTEGRYLYSNRYQQQLVGRPLEEIVGRDDAELFPKALADTLRANDARVLAGHTCTFEEVIELASGPRTYLSVKFPLPGGEGVPTALGGISTDITGRKQAERAMRESEERFRLLVEGVKDYAIFMLDTQGRIISWNMGAERIKGYEAREVLGQHLSLFYTPEDVAAGLPGKCLETAASRGYCRTEGLRVRKDGQRFWAEAIITALRDEAGVLRGFSKVTRDISERKKAEQTLLETTQRLRAILETAVDGIITIDERGLIQGVNPATTRLFGYAPEELHRPERQHPHARALPRRARRLHGPLPAHGRAQRHRHRARGGGPAQGRERLSPGAHRQRDAAAPGAVLHGHGARHHRAQARRAGPGLPRRRGDAAVAVARRRHHLEEARLAGRRGTCATTARWICWARTGSSTAWRWRRESRRWKTSSSGRGPTPP